MTQTFQLRQAARQKAKLRLALSGPTGAGKTVSALLMAYGITGDWSKIAVIDTENSSADLYADHEILTDKKKLTIGTFQVISFESPYSPERYIEAIQTAVEGGAEVIIIDSISHEWNGSGGILEIVDELKASSNTGNAFTSAWPIAGPRHNKFVEYMLHCNAHTISCMRSKMDYVMELNEKGKQVPKKLGLAPVQREGVEYEFTIHLDINVNNYANIQKDRSGLFADKKPFIPTVATGKKILEWCESGIDVPKNTVEALTDDVTEAIEAVNVCLSLTELEFAPNKCTDTVKKDARYRMAWATRREKLVKFHTIKSELAHG